MRDRKIVTGGCDGCGAFYKNINKFYSSVTLCYGCIYDAQVEIKMLLHKYETQVARPLVKKKDE